MNLDVRGFNPEAEEAKQAAAAKLEEAKAKLKQGEVDFWNEAEGKAPKKRQSIKNEADYWNQVNRKGGEAPVVSSEPGEAARKAQRLNAQTAKNSSESTDPQTYEKGLREQTAEKAVYVDEYRSDQPTPSEVASMSPGEQAKRLNEGLKRVQSERLFQDEFETTAGELKRAGKDVVMLKNERQDSTDQPFEQSPEAKKRIDDLVARIKAANEKAGVTRRVDASIEKQNGEELREDLQSGEFTERAMSDVTQRKIDEIKQRNAERKQTESAASAQESAPDPSEQEHDADRRRQKRQEFRALREQGIKPERTPLETPATSQQERATEPETQESIDRRRANRQAKRTAMREARGVTVQDAAAEDTFIISRDENVSEDDTTVVEPIPNRSENAPVSTARREARAVRRRELKQRREQKDGGVAVMEVQEPQAVDTIERPVDDKPNRQTTDTLNKETTGDFVTPQVEQNPAKQEQQEVPAVETNERREQERAERDSIKIAEDLKEYQQLMQDIKGIDVRSKSVDASAMKDTSLQEQILQNVGVLDAGERVSDLAMHVEEAYKKLEAMNHKLARRIRENYKERFGEEIPVEEEYEALTGETAEQAEDRTVLANALENRLNNGEPSRLNLRFTSDVKRAVDVAFANNQDAPQYRNFTNAFNSGRMVDTWQFMGKDAKGNFLFVNPREIPRMDANDDQELSTARAHAIALPKEALESAYDAGNPDATSLAFKE